MFYSPFLSLSLSLFRPATPERPSELMFSNLLIESIPSFLANFINFYLFVNLLFYSPSLSLFDSLFLANLIHFYLFVAFFFILPLSLLSGQRLWKAPPGGHLLPERQDQGHQRQLPHLRQGPVRRPRASGCLADFFLVNMADFL